MVAQVVPASVPSDGTVAVWWVPTLADPSAPKVTELNAAGAVKLECYLKENFTPNAEAELAEDRRMCSKQVFQTAGTVTYTIEELVGVYDPQDPTGTDVGGSSKAYAALAPGATGFIVARWGIDLEGTDAAPAVGQFVDAYPVTIATRRKMPQEANSQLKFGARPVITGSVTEDVALAA